jgi:hypothetical protein
MKWLFSIFISSAVVSSAHADALTSLVTFTNNQDKVERELSLMLYDDGYPKGYRLSTRAEDGSVQTRDWWMNETIGEGLDLVKGADNARALLNLKGHVDIDDGQGLFIFLILRI